LPIVEDLTTHTSLILAGLMLGLFLIGIFGRFSFMTGYVKEVTI